MHTSSEHNSHFNMWLICKVMGNNPFPDAVSLAVSFPEHHAGCLLITQSLLRHSWPGTADSVQFQMVVEDLFNVATLIRHLVYRTVVQWPVLWSARCMKPFLHSRCMKSVILVTGKYRKLWDRYT